MESVSQNPLNTKDALYLSASRDYLGTYVSKREAHLDNIVINKL